MAATFTASPDLTGAPKEKEKPSESNSGTHVRVPRQSGRQATLTLQRKQMKSESIAVIPPNLTSLSLLMCGAATATATVAFHRTARTEQ